MPPGDERERAEVLGRLRPRLVAWGASRLSREEAEDLAQDVLMLLHTKYAATPAAELLPLGIGIAWKMRAARWRKARRRGEASTVDVTDAALSDPGPSPEERASTNELKGRLLLALKQLNGRCRELVRLKLEDRTFPDIAEILRAKLNTVYSWDHRCMARLREILGGGWEGRE